MNKTKPQALFFLTVFELVSLGNPSVRAQENHIEGVVRVTVDTSKTRNYMGPRAMGMHTSVYDNSLADPMLPELLRAAGITTLRYPGGGYADIYHWSVHKATKWRAWRLPMFSATATKIS